MKISPELQKDLALLEKYDDAYYNKQALISDNAYDLLKDKVYRHLPPDHPRLAKIGHAVCSAWPKEKHTILMGSLEKSSTEDAIREWVEKVYDSLKLKKIAFLLQYKIDGFSGELKYKDGALDKGVTRGDGNVGELITPNMSLFRNIPSIIPINLSNKYLLSMGPGESSE